MLWNVICYIEFLCKSIPAGLKERVRKIQCYLFQLREVNNDLSLRKLWYYTDGDFWRSEHHGMFLSRGLKWYWGKIIKSRDEVEGLIFFPKYHFKPQDTGNIPWCSRQQSRHLLYCMATHCPHCLARLRHSSQKFTKLSIFFSGHYL